jgi:hypothetical protein
MTTNRREFIEHIGATAMLGALPIAALNPLVGSVNTPPATTTEEWDFSWTNKLKGKKHKGLFDCTEIESGFGVFRASVWEPQYHAALGAKPSETVTVLVLRHNALVLGMQQDAWDKFGIGAAEKVTHPLTQQGTTKNPALFTQADGVPAAWDFFALPKLISRGAVVLACNLALEHFSAVVAAKTGIPQPEARKQALASFVPGVTLMPSGVFSCVKAQQEGCLYVKAS